MKYVVNLREVMLYHALDGQVDDINNFFSKCLLS